MASFRGATSEGITKSVFDEVFLRSAFASSLDHCGVLTRNVKDAAIVVDNMKGIDKYDMTSWDSSHIHLADDLTEDVKGKKLFYIKELCDISMYENKKEIKNKWPS